MATRFSNPANVPMGSNRLSPIDQASNIKLDTGLVTGDVTLDNYSQPLPLNTSLASLQTGARNALTTDSNVGRYAVPGLGDLGQFAGSFDASNVPMGNNSYSPVDQAKMIARDIAIMEGTAPVMPRDKSGTIANLRGDSDAGRFAVPGYGDLGQFAGSGGGSGGGGMGGGSLGKYYDDMSASAYAKGGDVQMPQEAGANPFADPNTMAVYDQLRQTMSPKEFGDEMLAGAAQIDPEAMAQFRNELSQIDLSPEDLDMLNNMVDEILANPEQYAAVRAKYLEMGAPEELLPEQFDPQFFAAMNMAVDQLIAEPAGVQAFAQGGIAELKPIAKAIAGYGRNGDTMLAHITPAEARMLRRRGGSGTINPVTGLPEFFLKKAFKSIGKAVKKFANSTVGKIITTVALGFFLGPAAAGLVGATSAAGVAAVSGFVGGAGSTLLGGGNLKDALKAGAIGGLTAGVTTGVTQGFGTAYQGPTTVGGQVDRFTGMFKTPAFPQYTAQGALTDTATSNAAREAYAGELYKTNPEAFYNPNAATPDALTDFTSKKGSLIPDGQGGLKFPEGQTVGQTKLPGGQILTQNVPIDSTQFPGGPAYDPRNMAAANPSDFGAQPLRGSAGAYQTPTIGESFSKMGEGLGMGDSPASYKTFMEGAGDLFAPGPNNAQITARAQEIMSTTPGSTFKDAMAAASKELSPGFLRTYGPATLAGLGAVGLAGGFKATDAQPSAMRDELMKPVTQRIAEGGNQKAFYMQGLPGVKYDQYGAPIFGQYKPLPTFDTGLGIESLINPRAFAAGGAVTAANFDETAYLNANPDVKAELARLEGRGSFKNAFEHYSQYGQAEGRTAFDRAETAAAAAADAAAKEAAQAANRKLVADAKAAKKAAGFGDAYKNINAGLSYDVPAGIAATSIAARQAAFAPTMNKFTQAQAANAATLAQPYTPRVVAQPYNNASGYGNLVTPAANTATIGNTGTIGNTATTRNTATTGNTLNPALALDLMYRSTTTGAPTALFNQYGGYDAVKKMAIGAGFDATPEWQNSYKSSTGGGVMGNSGIASLAAGGYPRRTGQINGPGTGTSDSIPAMLSDGEFVMTAKAVRGAGKGNRRAGAKRMYALMNQLEKNAARG